MSDEKASKALVNAHRTHGISAISKAVKLLVDAHRTRVPALVGDVDLKTDQDAYRVQDQVLAELWPGAKPAAWKAGGPSDKVEPTASPIAPETVLRTPATVSASAMNMVGVEAEVAFRISRDLPPRTKPYSDREVAAAVGEVLVAIELCDTRLGNWKNTTGIWKLADFQNNGGLVAGSGTKDWQDIDFLQQEMEFRVGEKVSKARGGHSFGNPFRLVPWLARHAAKRGFGLHAGDLVTTGAWTGLEIAAAGDEVVAIFAGIGEARVRIN
jgi:2-keto-4-pentenoate hydratase